MDNNSRNINVILFILLLYFSCNYSREKRIHESFESVSKSFYSNRVLFENVGFSLRKQNKIGVITKENFSNLPFSLFYPFVKYKVRYKLNFFSSNENFYLEIPKGIESENIFWEKEDIKIINRDTMDVNFFIKLCGVDLDSFLNWFLLLRTTDFCTIYVDKNFIQFTNSSNSKILYTFNHIIPNEYENEKGLIKKIDIDWIFIY